VIDATCPLVTKVHIEAVKFARQGLLAGAGSAPRPRRIEGTLGERLSDPGGVECGGGCGSQGARSGSRAY